MLLVLVLPGLLPLLPGRLVQTGSLLGTLGRDNGVDVSTENPYTGNLGGSNKPPNECLAK